MCLQDVAVSRREQIRWEAVATNGVGLGRLAGNPKRTAIVISKTGNVSALRQVDPTNSGYDWWTSTTSTENDSFIVRTEKYGQLVTGDNLLTSPAINTTIYVLTLELSPGMDRAAQAEGADIPEG